MGLASGTKHIPFRSNKLSNFLKDILISSQICLIFCVNESKQHFLETLETLKFSSAIQQSVYRRDQALQKQHDLSMTSIPSTFALKKNSVHSDSYNLIIKTL